MNDNDNDHIHNDMMMIIMYNDTIIIIMYNDMYNDDMYI